MKTYDATEQAYKNGYKNGYEEGFKEGYEGGVDVGKRNAVKHGRWILTANEECSNYRWNVTAECSECHHSKGEIYAAFFPAFPPSLAMDVLLDSAKSVKLDNFCSECGADMRD